MKFNNITKRKFSYLKVFLFLIIFSLSINLFSQENILLSKNDMPNYEWISQAKKHWLVGNNNQIKFGIGQKWKIKDFAREQYIYINYFEFTSIPSAFIGTAYSSQHSPAPYTWGSLTGQTIGDETWTLSDDKYNKSNSIYFVLGNFGIQIFSPFYQDPDFKHRIEKIANTIIKNINKQLINESNSLALTIKLDSISTNLLEKTKNNLNSILQDYKLSNSKYSTWIIDSVEYQNGLRKEWTKDSLTIGIDICQFKNSNEAKLAAEIKSDNCSISKHIYDL